MNNMNTTYSAQNNAILERESVMQILRSRETARLVASEAKYAHLSAVAPAGTSAFEALALAKLNNQDQLTRQNQLARSMFAQKQNSSIFALSASWQENNNTTNALLSSLANEAQLKRESAMSRLSGFNPTRPSMGLSMRHHLIANNNNHGINKRGFDSIAFPPAVTQSAYSPVAKRQRLEDRLSPLEMQALKSLQTTKPPPLCAPSAPKETSQPNAKVIAMSCDRDNLTTYQCVAREQIELFAAGEREVEAGTKGRNRSIVAGQVGIRCRHCAHLPQRARAKGSTIYPSKLSGIYQASQNMANSHIAQHCQEVPAEIKHNLKTLANRKSSAGGGRDYWASGAKILGACEDSHGLRFHNEEGSRY